MYQKLVNKHLERTTGEIIFKMASTGVKINSTDTVGNSIQSWLGQYMAAISIIENLLARHPENWQPIWKR